jgi:hypothetical protein
VAPEALPSPLRRAVLAAALKMEAMAAARRQQVGLVRLAYLRQALRVVAAAVASLLAT